MTDTNGVTGVGGARAVWGDTSVGDGEGVTSLGDVNALLARLEGVMQREESAERKLRRVSQTLSRAALEAQVSDLRDAADARFAAGIAKAAGDMLGSALEFTSAVTGNNSQTRDGQYFASLEKGSSAISEMISASYTADADRSSAAATAAGGVVDSAKRDADEAGSAADDARHARDKTLEQVAQVADARSQAQMAATRA